MSYTIYHYNPNLPAITTVADGTIDTSLDIKLIGKSYAGYGQAQNENFVYLLENFSNPIAPVNPLTGQIWYDSGNSKLKFYDGTKFRTAGGAEVGATSPTGLSQGDFWFDTTSNQLFSWNGTSFTLIGPQAVVGSGTTQMQSISLRDVGGGSHAVIAAYDNGNVVFTVSSDSQFVQDATANATLGFSTGFTTIYPGVTLVNTNNASKPGVTSDVNHKFWGTASNADQLGGIAASGYVQASNASFSTTVNFSDTGYTVGNPIVKLAVFNSGSTTPTIQSTVASTPIVFQTTNASSVTVTPLQLLNSDVLPGTTLASNLGSNSLKWNSIYANYVFATSQQADALTINATASGNNQAVIANTTGQASIVARDTGGNINVTLMNGIATKANTLLLGSSYVSTATTNTASTIAARDASGNITATQFIGTATQANTLAFNGSFVNAATTNTVSTVVARDSSGNFSAGTITANLTGNTTGIHTGNLKASDNTVLIDATSKIFYGSVSGIVNGSASQANTLQVNNSTYESCTTASTASTVVARDSSSDIYCNILHGTATAADWADLAEKYLADEVYPIGTVISIGGTKEVTACQTGDRAIGVVSANPAFRMNEGLQGGTYIALKGRVPVLINGPITKGDGVIAGTQGSGTQASKSTESGVFAIALNTDNSSGIRLVECLVL